MVKQANIPVLDHGLHSTTFHCYRSKLFRSKDRMYSLEGREKIRKQRKTKSNAARKQSELFGKKKTRTNFWLMRMRQRKILYILFSFASLSRIENISIISKDANNTTVCGGSRQHLSLFTLKYKYKREKEKVTVQTPKRTKYKQQRIQDL